jgi:hypothetical protein
MDGDGERWWTLAQWRAEVERALADAQDLAQLLSARFGPSAAACAVQSMALASAREACAVVEQLGRDVVDAAFGDGTMDATVSSGARAHRAAWHGTVSERHESHGGVEESGLVRRVRRGVSDAAVTLARRSHAHWLPRATPWAADEWSRVDSAWRERLGRWHGEEVAEASAERLASWSGAVRGIVRWAKVEEGRGVVMGLDAVADDAKFFAGAEALADCWTAGDGVLCRRRRRRRRRRQREEDASEDTSLRCEFGAEASVVRVGGAGGEEGERDGDGEGEGEGEEGGEEVLAPLFPFVTVCARAAIPVPVLVWAAER